MKIVRHFSNSYFGQAIGELIAPTRCAGCERQGVLLCPSCLESFQDHYVSWQSCPRCAGPFGALSCTECWEVNYSFSAALALGILDGALARSIVLYKDANERRLASTFGGLLAQEIQCNWGQWADVVCWVPSTKTALRRRGFDHAELLAKSVATSLNLPARPLLLRSKHRSQHDQRGLSRAQRKSVALQLHCTQRVPSCKVLLIDDVFTTGATAEAASTALLSAGAQELRVAVLGRAW
jgi:predicted amidophosphoribosyltransferase